MTSATLNRVSLVTEVDSEYCDPDVRHFLDPAHHDPGLSRVLIHEAVHYWQQLSQMNLLAVAAEDWARLRVFRSTGSVPPPGPLRGAFRTPHAAVGFSAHDLAESAARYWDLLNVGPHNLVESALRAGQPVSDETRSDYDRLVAVGLFRSTDDGFSEQALGVAMKVVAGRYALPYLRLRDRIGGDAIFLFPLVAHWALQTANPVEMFDVLAARASRSTARIARWQRRLSRAFTGQRILVRDITDTQMQLYPHLSRAMYELAKREGSPMWTVTQYLPHTSLADHPVYGWAHRWSMALGRHAARTGLADDMANLFGRSDRAELLPVLAADRVMALPGGPQARGLLAQFLLPPVHRFADDRTWFTAQEDEHADNEALAESCMVIHGWWEELRQASRGY